MRKRAGKSSISAFAALMVFALFTACALCVLLSGVGAYRRLVHDGQEHYARRTMTQYIAARVQQSGAGACVAAEPFGAGDALVISEEIDGETYLTRVYSYDGWLMELFAHESGEFAPEDGEKLLPAGEMFCDVEDGLLTVTVADAAGTTWELIFALRGGEGDGL